MVRRVAVVLDERVACGSLRERRQHVRKRHLLDEWDRRRNAAARRGGFECAVAVVFRVDVARVTDGVALTLHDDHGSFEVVRHGKHEGGRPTRVRAPVPERLPGVENGSVRQILILAHHRRVDATNGRVTRHQVHRRDARLRHRLHGTHRWRRHVRKVRDLEPRHDGQWKAISIARRVAHRESNFAQLCMRLGHGNGRFDHRLRSRRCDGLFAKSLFARCLSDRRVGGVLDVLLLLRHPPRCLPHIVAMQYLAVPVVDVAFLKDDRPHVNVEDIVRTHATDHRRLGFLTANCDSWFHLTKVIITEKHVVRVDDGVTIGFGPPAPKEGCIVYHDVNVG